MTTALASPPHPHELELLRLVDTNRERRCKVLLEAADAEARALVASARRAALARVRRAARDQRERGRLAIEAASAEISTGLRLLEQQVRRRWLDAVWPRLVATLEARWTAADRRQRWLRAVVELAIEVLPASDAWRVSCPAQLDAAELDAHVRAMAEHAGCAPELVPVAALAHGIRIEADGATVDGTLAGLLANAEQIESKLLAELVSGGAT